MAKEGDQWEGKFLSDFKTPVWRVSWSLTGNILAFAKEQRAQLEEERYLHENRERGCSPEEDDRTWLQLESLLATA